MNCSISAILRRISATQACQSLADIDEVSLDTSFHPTTQRICRCEINAPREYLFKKQLQINELEEPDRTPIELDKHIHIAVRTGFISCDGSEEGK